MEKIITCSSCDSCYSVIPIDHRGCDSIEYCCCCGNKLEDEEIQTDYSDASWPSVEDEWEDYE